MNAKTSAALVLYLSIPVFGQCRAGNEGEDIVRVAVNAMCDLKTASGYTGCEWQVEQVTVGNDTAVGIRIAVWCEPPDKSRWEYGDGTGKIHMIVVRNGKEIWTKKEEGEATREESGVRVMSPLDVLVRYVKRDPKLVVSYVGQDDIEGNKSDGVIIKAPDYESLRLWFDHRTHLLVKASCDVTRKKVGEGGTESIKVEWHYADYHVTEGMHIPRMIEIVIDGKKSSSVRVLNVRLHKVPLSAALFMKP
jgi:hypothetical protein